MEKMMDTSLPKTMKAAVVNGAGEKFEIKQVSLVPPGPNEVLVKIAMSGVCHTDVHAADGDWPVKPNYPLITGHEGAGTVVALGPGVEDVKIGDRVGVPWLYSACQSCEHCWTGWETLCEKQKNCGYSVNGGHAEYCIAAASHIARIPDGLSFEQAAPILCAGVTTYKGLVETEVKPNESVVIVGAAGGLGHLAVQYAKAMGMTVVAIDTDESKLSFCKSLGADFAINGLDSDAIEQVHEVTNGGAHGCLNLAPSIKAFSQSVMYLRRKGTIVFVALPPGGFQIPAFDVALKRLTLRGSIVGTRQDMQESLRLAAQSKVKSCIELDTIENINGIFQKLREGKITGRVVLKM